MKNEIEKKQLQECICVLEEEVSSIEAVIATLDLQIESVKLKAEKENLEHERNVHYQELEKKNRVRKASIAVNDTETF